MESVIDLAGTKKYCLAITCKQAWEAWVATTSDVGYLVVCWPCCIFVYLV